MTLCRLLHFYSSYFGAASTSHSINDLDDLVTNLITWLRSIGGGLRSHVAHMLSNVVAEQQKKLRPEAVQRSSPVETEDTSPYDVPLLWPDFMTADAFDGNGEGFWPAWEQ